MKIKYLLLTILGLASTNFFLLINFSQLPVPVAAFSLISLLYIPGILINLILKINFENIWIFLIHTLGISITFIYVLGLLASYLLPGIGFDKPLALTPFAYMHFGIVIILVAISFIRNWTNSITLEKFAIISFKFIAVALSITLCLIAVIGAFYLNNGSSNTITYTWLSFLIIIFFLFSLFKNNNLVAIRPYIIFTLSLSILWSLSARSWHLIGWDIVQEFGVAKATLIEGKWSPGNIRDAYNACLSITILPTVMTNLTSFPIEGIFKYVYPFVFAHFPVTVYFLLKKLSNKNFAYLSVFYIIAQPFFIQPMIALARQEIAFFFFPLILLTINSEIKNKFKIFLTIFYIFALVTSHYSTTYISILIFGLVYLAVLFLKAIRWLPFPDAIKHSKLYVPWIITYKSSIKWWVVVSLILFSYVWYFLITESAGNITMTIQDSFSNMSQMFKGEQKSQEVKQALPGMSNSIYTTQEDVELFQSTNNIVEGLNNIPIEKLNEIEQRYPLQAVREDLISPAINKADAKNFRLVLDLFKDSLKYFLVIGTGLLVLRSLLRNQFNKDIVIFSSVCTFVLLVIILHPTIGVSYNVSRIYLQLLVFLAFSLIVGLDSLLFFFKEKLRILLSSSALLIMFFYLQGMLVPYIGGVPVLQLYNLGTDYEKFYVYQGELNAAGWLRETRSFKSTVYADDLTGLRLRKEASFFPNTTIIPVVIANNAQSYVYISNNNKNKGKATVTFNNKSITYTYPRSFLNDNKNLVYSNYFSSIYK